MEGKMEEKTRTKFKTQFQEKISPSHPQIKKLINWGKSLHVHGLVPSHGRGSEGNLSLRTEKGFIITTSQSKFESLRPADFVEVVSYTTKPKTVKVRGVKEPSSETFLHALIYEERPEVSAVFHFHDDAILGAAEKLRLAETKKEKSYGTVGLARQVLKVLDDRWFIVMKNHGVLSLGSSPDEAGERALNIHGEAVQPT